MSYFDVDRAPFDPFSVLPRTVAHTYRSRPVEGHGPNCRPANPEIGCECAEEDRPRPRRSGPPCADCGRPNPDFHPCPGFGLACPCQEAR